MLRSMWKTAVTPWSRKFPSISFAHIRLPRCIVITTGACSKVSALHTPRFFHCNLQMANEAKIYAAKTQEDAVTDTQTRPTGPLAPVRTEDDLDLQVVGRI